MARVMVISGVVTVVLGVVLGALVWAPLYALALIAVVDFALAWAYANGRLRTASGGSAAEPAAVDPAADPSFNPYARED